MTWDRRNDSDSKNGVHMFGRNNAIYGMAAYTTYIILVLIFANILTFVGAVAEQLTVSPQQSFLQDNQSITLLWRYQSDDLVDGQLSPNFIFYHDGEQLGTEGGGATKTYPGKPYVDYVLTTRKSGLLTGEVGRVNSTANVYEVPYEAEVLVTKAGSNLKLTCDGGPDSAVKTWQVDGTPVEEAGLENFFVTYDKSLLVQNIDFSDGLKRISCRQFFSEDDLYEFRTNNLAVPVYKAAITTNPIIVYETVERSDSTYVVEVGTWKKGVVIRICSQQDGEGVCEDTTANTTAELDRKNSNFTIQIGNASLVSGSFKGSKNPVEEKVEPDESDSTVGIIVGVILGILVVAGVLIFLIIVRRKRKLCFMETTVSKEDQAGMKPLVSKDENGLQDAVEMKEIEKKEPPDEKQPALEELEAMEDEEVNPLLLDNYKKKEVVEPEKYDLGQPKYLKNRQKTATENEDKPDTKTELEQDDKLLEKEAYDLLMEFDVHQTWDQFKLTATKIDDFLETRLKLPDKPGSDVTGSLYMNGKDILPRGFVSYVSSSKGNCLFNSASAVLYGNEDHTNRLRLATLLDGINKSDFYVKQYFKDKEKDELLKFLNSCLSEDSIKQLETDRQEETGYLAEFIVQMAIREMSVPDSKCNPLQVQFLSSAIDLPVLQYFQKGYQDFYGQPVKDYEVVKPAGMTGSVKAQNKDCVFMLWVCESQKLYIDGGRLDYIVPVVKKIHKNKDT